MAIIEGVGRIDLSDLNESHYKTMQPITGKTKMNKAILITLSRDKNGNSCLFAKLEGYVSVKRQRDKSISLEDDLRAIGAELCIKNGLFVSIDNNIYQINDKQFVCVSSTVFRSVFN